MARPSSFDRQEALSNARDLFWRKGFHATSLKDIEGALSLKPGSIYAAFGSKQALFAEALKLYAQEAQTEFLDCLKQAESPLDAVIAYVRGLTIPKEQCAPSNACMIFKTALELVEDDSDLKQIAGQQLSSTAERFAEAFELARQKGELADNVDPHRAALKLQSNLTGMRGMIEGGLPPEDIKNLNDDIISDLERLRA